MNYPDPDAAQTKDKKSRRGKKYSNKFLPPVLPKDQYIPLMNKPQEEFEVDGEVYFDDKFIRINFCDESMAAILKMASQIVFARKFTCPNPLFTAANVEILDYFEMPLDSQPLGSYNGRISMKFKWLVKTLSGEFVVKPQVLKIFLVPV